MQIEAERSKVKMRQLEQITKYRQKEVERVEPKAKAVVREE
jgi:hypothetical protein